MTLAESLDAGLAELRLPLPAPARTALLDYVALLAKWNGVYNLTAIREPARMVTHHLLDSLSIVPALDAFVGDRSDVALLDVGSGAGLPGIPIAVARPAWRVTMLEPVHKKSAFITQAIAELQLSNAIALAVRAEEHRQVPPAVVAVSRAFADLSSFADAAIRHIAADGALMAMKGVHPDEELRELPPQFKVTKTLSLQVPGIDAARHLLVLQREGAGVDLVGASRA
jgi:16S rRNA (guanine527-N7)-methyltransferase